MLRVSKGHLEMIMGWPQVHKFHIFPQYEKENFMKCFWLCSNFHPNPYLLKKQYSAGQYSTLDFESNSETMLTTLLLFG